MYLSAEAYNLKTYLKFTQKLTQTQAKEAQKALLRAFALIQHFLLGLSEAEGNLFPSFKL